LGQASFSTALSF